VTTKHNTLFKLSSGRTLDVQSSSLATEPQNTGSWGGKNMH